MTGVPDAARQIRSALAPPLAGAAAGFVVGVALYAVSFDPSCCVCDPGRALRWFPHAILFAYGADKTLPFSSPITWLEWPAYGLALGAAWTAGRPRGRRFAALLVFAIFVVLVLHHLDATRDADAWVRSFPYEPG